MALGPIIFDIEGTQLTSEDKEILEHSQIGGVILFARNYVDPDTVIQLMAEIRNIRPEALVMVDQEGGRVQRFKQGLTKLPSLRLLGRLWDAHSSSRHCILEMAEQLGTLMALEILSFNIDLSLAPVVDLDKGLNEVIGERAFHSDVEPTIELARHYIQGMQKGGMKATLKHFPGHGSVTLDSHHDLPIDERHKDDIKIELSPFKALIPEENVKAIMPAHIIYKQLDSKPAGFSSFWLKDILRQSLKFDGAIISDDVSMQAAHFMGDYVTRVNKALEAGCDIVLACNNRDGVKDILTQLNHIPTEDSQRRIQALRASSTHHYADLHKNQLWQEAKEGLKKFEGLCACLNPSLV